MKKQIFTIIILLMGGVSAFGQSFRLDATGANDMRLRTNSIDRVNILTNGNVGIGTSTPDTKLHVWSGNAGSVTAPTNTIATFESGTAGFLTVLTPASSVSGITFVSPPGITTQGFIAYESTSGRMRLGANNENRITIDGTGKIGIGTTVPVSKLHIISNGNSGRSPNSNTSLFTESGGNNYLEIATPDNGERGVMFSNPTDGNSGGIYYYNKDMYFNTNSNDRRMTILANGNIGIGTNTPNNKLDVKGIMRAEELMVETGWADYVFEPEFKLKSLKEVEHFIKINKHLPDILPASTIQEKGLPVAAMTTKMMQKIEELTLYIIDQDKKILEIQKQLLNLKKD